MATKILGSDDAIWVIEQAAVVATRRVQSSSLADRLVFGTSSENETSLFGVIQDVLAHHGFDRDEVQLVAGQRFPDIVFPGCKVGVEVKGHEKDGRIMGNSIMGSKLAVDGVTKVLVLVWNKKSGTVVCRDYFACVVGAEVTHSPRFVLEVDPPEERKLFGEGLTSIGLAEEVCLGPDGFDSELILARMRALALSKGEIPWWIHDRSDGAQDSLAATTTMSLDRFTSLPTDDRLLLVRTALVLFPEVMSSAQQKYSKVFSWAISTKSVLMSRDAFSADGVVRRAYRPLCETCQVPLGRVLVNAIEWLTPSAVIELKAIEAVLDVGVTLESLADRFKSKLCSMSLKRLHEIFLSGPDRRCQCQSMSHEDFRTTIAEDIGQRILALNLL